ATLTYPSRLIVDTRGNLYIGEAALSGSKVRKVSPDGVITTAAGKYLYNDIPDGGAGGMATLALLSGLLSVAMDNAGNLYIAENSQNRIRKVAANGVISTLP